MAAAMVIVVIVVVVVVMMVVVVVVAAAVVMWVLPLLPQWRRWRWCRPWRLRLGWRAGDDDTRDGIILYFLLLRLFVLKMLAKNFLVRLSVQSRQRRLERLRRLSSTWLVSLGVSRSKPVYPALLAQRSPQNVFKRRLEQP